MALAITTRTFVLGDDIDPMTTAIEFFVIDDGVLHVDAFALQPFLNAQYPNEALFSRQSHVGKFTDRFLKYNSPTRIMTEHGEKLFVSVDAVLLSKPINKNPSTMIVQRLNELKQEHSSSTQSSSAGGTLMDIVSNAAQIAAIVVNRAMNQTAMMTTMILSLMVYMVPVHYTLRKQTKLGNRKDPSQKQEVVQGCLR